MGKGKVISWEIPLKTVLPEDVANQLLSPKGRGLILYDGECGLCRRWVQFVLNHDFFHYFYFASLQGPIGNIFSPKPENVKSNYDTILLFENGKLYEKSRAAFRIAASLSRPWNLLKVFVIVPRTISDFFYDFVARRRHHLASDTCIVPTKEEQNKFLDLLGK